MWNPDVHIQHHCLECQKWYHEACVSSGERLDALVALPELEKHYGFAGSSTQSPEVLRLMVIARLPVLRAGYSTLLGTIEAVDSARGLVVEWAQDNLKQDSQDWKSRASKVVTPDLKDQNVYYLHCSCGLPC